MSTLREYRCPHCQTLIETNRRLGSVIQCPDCSESFSLDAKLMTQRGGSPNAALYKILVPLGYVAFVAVPLACSLYFLMKKADKQPEEQAAAVQESKEAPKAERSKQKAEPPAEKPKSKGKQTNSPHSEDQQSSSGNSTSAGSSASPLAAPNDPEPGVVSRGPEQLFAGMPDENHPKSGAEGTIERAAAKKWANAKLVGRMIEWTAPVARVEVLGEDPFTVNVHLNPRPGYDEQKLAIATPSLPFGSTFFIGDQVCIVRLTGAGDQHKLAENATLSQNLVRFDACNPEQAKQLRSTAGRQLVLSFQIGKVSLDSDAEDGGRVIFGLQVQLKKLVIMPAASGPVVVGPSVEKPKENGGATLSAPTESKKTPAPSETVSPAQDQAMAVAPPPREAAWRVPFTGFESDWQKLGVIDVRLAGLGVSKVPVIDAKGNVTESKNPLLVVMVEARKNTPSDKKRFLYAWQRFIDNKITGTSPYSLLLPDGKEVQPGRLGGKLKADLPEKQPLLDDGTVVRDFLLFTVPAEDAGNLTLILTGERCGEAGEFSIEIPRGAWLRK